MSDITTINERIQYLEKLLVRMSSNFEGTVYEICHELRDYVAKELEDLNRKISLKNHHRNQLIELGIDPDNFEVTLKEEFRPKGIAKKMAKMVKKYNDDKLGVTSLDNICQDINKNSTKN